MLIARHFDHLPEALRGAVVAIGNFDGVHLGHQALIAEGERIAEDMRAPFGVLAFEPQPQQFFRRSNEKFRLTPFRSKAALLERFGVDIFYAVPFNAAMAGMSARDFIERVLVRGLGVKHILIGRDFQFGKDRGGDVAMLEAAGQEFGFGVTIFAAVMGEGGVKISSTDIRKALREGRPRDAARWLGHRWRVAGHVQHGDQRGRTIGFPTANIPLKGYMEPALGVYAVRAFLGDRRLTGVANFGRRPTFDKQDTLLEVHLFDFNEDLYGRTLDVAFADFIRAERKFDGLASLKAQIAADSDEARRLLAAP